MVLPHASIKEWLTINVIFKDTDNQNECLEFTMVVLLKCSAKQKFKSCTTA